MTLRNVINSILGVETEARLDEVAGEMAKKIRCMRISSGICCHYMVKSGQYKIYEVRDMRGVVNDVEKIFYSNDEQEWEKLTGHLGSLIQVALIHTFATITEEYVFGQALNVKSICGSSKEKSIRYSHSYVDEYSRKSYRYCREKSLEIYEEMHRYLLPYQSKLDPVINRINAQLLMGETLSYESIAELIESELYPIH